MPKINNIRVNNDLFFTSDNLEAKTIRESCIDDFSLLDDTYLEQLKKIPSKKKKLIEQHNAGVVLIPNYVGSIVSPELMAKRLLIENASVKTKSIHGNGDVIDSTRRNKAANEADVAKGVLMMKKESNQSPKATNAGLVSTAARDKPKKVDDAVKQILPMRKPSHKSTEVTSQRVSNSVIDQDNRAKENKLGEYRVVENEKVNVFRIYQKSINVGTTHNTQALPQVSYDNRIGYRIASEKNHDLILDVPKKQVESLSKVKLSGVTGTKFDDSATSKLKNNKKETKNNLVSPMDGKVNVEGRYASSAIMPPTLDSGMISSAIKHMIECVEKELLTPTISQTSQEDNVMVYHFNQWHGNNSVTFHFDKEKSELLYMEPSNTFVEKQLAANIDSFPAKYRAYIRDGDGQEHQQRQHREEENDEKDTK